MPEAQHAPQIPSPDHYLVSASGRLGDPPRSATTEVARILAAASAAAPAHGLVIHFHGGLNSRPYALENIVAPLTGRYLSANAYPLFFVWESGLMEALRNNKTELLRDPAFRELVKKVSEWAIKTVSLRGAIGFRGTGGQWIEDEDAFRRDFDDFFNENPNTPNPPTESADVPKPGASTVRARSAQVNADDLAQEIEAQLDNDPAFKKALQEAYNASIPVTQIATRGAGTRARADQLTLAPAALDEMFPPEGAHAASADGKVKTRGIFGWAGVTMFVARLVIAVVKRYAAGRDHGMYCTVVEEVLRKAISGDLIGATVWNAMKGDTLDSFGAAPECCGSAVVSELKRLQDAGQGIPTLTLVGHSTGAIYICNFLDAAARLGLEADIRVVFLAPAITCERFAQAIAEHETTRLKSFRMFAMRDARERADRMITPLYTHSLLYFVSGLLEGNAVGDGWNSVVDMPLVGMERFYTHAGFADDPSVQAVTRFLNAAPDRVVWSRAADQAAGLNSDSQKHGDFDNDEATLASLVAFVQH